MLAVFVWQGLQLTHSLARRNRTEQPAESIIVFVDGTVKKPGQYRIPVGTTTFEILQVAGVLSTSDLSPFNLAQQVAKDDSLTVGTLEHPVAVSSDIKLEFFFGDFSIISSEGIDRAPTEGMSIDEKDRVITEEKTQAELSVNNYSRIDIDNFSEMSFDKISIDSAGNRLVQAFLKSGSTWHKITYANEKELFRCVTPHAGLTVAGKGADYTMEVKSSETIINVNDGLLLIERPDGTDAINLISGQSVIIYNDGRPFQISKLTVDIGITDRFNALTKTKNEIILKQMPFNFLFCSPPYSFYLISIQFDINNVRVIHLPFQTSVASFVQGFSTLQEAFLYGGIVFTSTLIERIISTRISKHIVFGKEDIIRAVGTLGGLNIGVDDKASSILKIKKGTTLLKGAELVVFLRPDVSGFDDSEKRQIAVLKAIFDLIQSKGIVLSSLIIEQVLANLETNITTGEALQQYNRFTARKNWSFKNYSLPVRAIKEGDKTIYEPILEESRKILLEQ
jgi:hypothetical protein